MKPVLRKTLRVLGWVLGVALFLAALAGGWFYLQLRASLPQLDGTVRLAGVAASVTVTRDALGVPTLRGRTRDDIARALGFLHAQERFFQMDLLRRRAAGELAELFGRSALPVDKATRVHGFRALAGQVLAKCSPAERSLLEAYTAGANAGLSALRQKPFEYLALRTDPVPWQPLDSILVIYAMTLDVQDANNSYERDLTVLRDQLGANALAFFAPLLTPDDAALDDSTAPLPPIPSAREIDLRTATKPTATLTPPPAAPAFAQFAPPAAGEFPGSNSFAIDGAHTATGAALLANDPHLNLAVPNIWYRADLAWTDPAPQHLVGVTLAGLPLIVLGTNTRVAWGFTVAYADTADFVTIAINRVDPTLYKIPGRDDLVEIEKRRDTIRVKGGDPVPVEYEWSHWGPIVSHTDKGLPIACRWVHHDPAAINLHFLELESATTVAEAVDIAHRSGIPAHNFVVADRAGAIAWTIIGTLPKRVGFDGRLSVSWTYGDRYWDGFLPPNEYPVITNPSEGYLWTANNRLVGGAALRLIGDGGFANPARAKQIRNSLDHGVKHHSNLVTAQEIARNQCDDRAIFLAWWHGSLLRTLRSAPGTQNATRQEMRRLVDDWGARAIPESVGYRLVRAYRLKVAELVFTPLFASCLQAAPGFDWRRFHYDAPLARLLDEKPPHLLNPAYATWDDLLLAAADGVAEDLKKQGIPLSEATWGRRNTARLLHPFGRILPRWLTGWLNMPADPLAGDSNMPRIQTPTFGASMRLVVSPGREAEGLFQMPGGQSGHPLSPYYRAGHAAWVRGEPGPLLPGPTVHTLTLTP